MLVVGLDAQPAPGKVAFQRQGIAERDSVVRCQIDEKSVTAEEVDALLIQLAQCTGGIEPPDDPAFSLRARGPF